MNIGYMCPYEKLGCGESEARERIKFCVEKLGHSFIELDSKNYTFENKIYAEKLKLDCVFSHCVVEQRDIVFPDIFSCFFYWCPSAFFNPQMATDYLLYMNKHDIVVGGYESYYTHLDLASTKYFDANNLLKFCASVPKDYCIEPQMKENYKLFYVGMNVGLKARYDELFKFLDKENLIDIYGPQEAFGKRNTYSKYKAYKGNIPFDGRTILSKINNAGICLALNSNVHNSVNYVSNRIYEAAASGAIIISDKNSYVEKYFGNSVFYIDIHKSEEDINQQIMDILLKIKHDPKKAYCMACESQRIFIEKLSLDDQVEKLINHIVMEKEKMDNIKLQSKVVDIICFVNNLQEYFSIKSELLKQCYKNLRLVIVAEASTCESLRKCDSNISEFIVKNKHAGKTFVNIISAIKSDFFMFMDVHSCCHSNHLYKNLHLLEQNNNNFCYSATYIKTLNDYQMLNNRKINANDLKSFINDVPEDSFILEEILAMSSVLFNSKILKFVDKQELLNLSSGIHIYLILCSLLRNNDIGTFSYALTSGYKDVKKQWDLFETNRKVYKEERRSKNLLQYELRLIFLNMLEEKNNKILPKDLIKENLKFVKFKLKIKKKFLALMYFLSKDKIKFTRKINYCNQLINEINNYK